MVSFKHQTTLLEDSGHFQLLHWLQINVRMRQRRKKVNDRAITWSAMLSCVVYMMIPVELVSTFLLSFWSIRLDTSHASVCTGIGNLKNDLKRVALNFITGNLSKSDYSKN